MKVKGLFWNICRQSKRLADPIIDVITQAVRDKEVNLLLLCECNSYTAKEILEELQQSNPSWIQICYSNLLYAFSNIPEITGMDQKNKFYNLKNDYRTKILPITFGEEPLQILLFLVHLKSKQARANNDPYTTNVQLVNFLKEYEKSFYSNIQYNKNCTIIVGDFNLNPFELIMTDEAHLDAVHHLKYRSFIQRINNKAINAYFYNPMWRFLSDADKREFVSGTITWKDSSGIQSQMPIFDQIIYRPQLDAFFEHSNLQILNRVGQRNLIISEQGNEIQEIIFKDNNEGLGLFIDHLPIIFEFNFSKIMSNELWPNLTEIFHDYEVLNKDYIKLLEDYTKEFNDRSSGDVRAWLAEKDLNDGWVEYEISLHYRDAPDNFYTPLFGLKVNMDQPDNRILIFHLWNENGNTVFPQMKIATLDEMKIEINKRIIDPIFTGLLTRVYKEYRKSIRVSY